MFRKLLCSMVVMVIAIGFVAADEFNAVIKKVDDGKVTFYKSKTKTTDKSDDMTLPAAKDVKVNKGTAKKGKVEVGDAIEGGLKSETFTKIGEKGLNVRITTDADNKTITAIVVTMKAK